MSALMSAAAAPPRFTMKLACLAEISAPLRRLPLSPTFSMSRVAVSPGGYVHQALDAAEVDRGGLADQRGEAHARPRHRLLAVELGATEAALELEHHPAHAAVAHQQVVAAADDVERELLPLR